MVGASSRCAKFLASCSNADALGNAFALENAPRITLAFPYKNAFTFGDTDALSNTVAFENAFNNVVVFLNAFKDAYQSAGQL